MTEDKYYKECLKCLDRLSNVKANLKIELRVDGTIATIKTEAGMLQRQFSIDGGNSENSSAEIYWYDGVVQDGSMRRIEYFEIVAPLSKISPDVFVELSVKWADENMEVKPFSDIVRRELLGVE